MFKQVSLLLSALLVGSVAACTTITSIANTAKNTANQAQPLPRNDRTDQNQSNVVALFLVKKDNLKQEFRGEIYPIAHYLKGRYLEASQDLTPQVRDTISPDRLIELNRSRSILTAETAFTVLNNQQTIGQFNIEKLGVSQFACSTILVGQGHFDPANSLPQLFETLPKERAGSLQGFLAGREFNESWRWTLAVSRPTALASPTIATDPARYQADVLAAAQPILAQQANGKLAGAPAIEQVAVFNLDRDGQPEVQATIRQGRDPKTLQPEQRDRGEVPVYLSLWLSYRSGKPIVISQNVTRYEIPVSRQPDVVAGTLDVDGNGVEEVIVQQKGYESTGFAIYEFDGNQLKQVFQGASYGC